MYISTNILKEYINLDGLDLEELINKFSLSTAEVEGIIKKGYDILGVKVGKVVSLKKIENEDKLCAAEIDIGEKKLVKTVCSAPNIKEGILIAFAKAGSKVLGEEIKLGTIKGHESAGVCLSEKELGISDDHTGIMILEDNLKIGTDIKDIFEIEDILFEIDNKSLTNRPDLWGHYGIAREFAALANKELKPLEIDDLEKYSSLPKLKINIDARDLCSRYSAIAIENINKYEASMNMKIRLYYLKMRSINLLADLTNYVMLEVGQPLHAFDKSKVNSIDVKTFSTHTSFITLDAEERKIPKDTLCICDGPEVLAIAGIMGGIKTQITKDTNSLILESANFDATSIRKSATKLGLRTEASTRYEKSLDPELTITATARYIKLLKDIDPNIQIVSSYTDEYIKKYEKVIINISKEYIDKKIGMPIEIGKIKNILNLLGFEIIRESKNEEFEILVPSYRATKDISIKADIVEEIARIYGYLNIIPKQNSWPLQIVEESDSMKIDRLIKDLLVIKYAANEVHSYIWYESKKLKELGVEYKDNVKIINSLTAENNTLRETMIPTLIVAMEKNIKNYNEMGIFEIGKVFKYDKDKKEIVENKNLGIIYESKCRTDKDLVRIAMNTVRDIIYVTKRIKKIEIEKLKEEEIQFNYMSKINSCKITVQGVEIAVVSLLNEKIKENSFKKSSIIFIEMHLDKLNELIKTSHSFDEVSKYQTVVIDLSLVIDKNLEFKYIENIIENSRTMYLKSYEIIDIFEGFEKLSDKKSITIRFILGSNEKTLTGDEINSCINNLITNFEKSKYNIVVRK